MSSGTHGPAVLGLALLASLAASCAGTRDVDVTPTVRTTVDAHIGRTFNGDSTRVSDISSEFNPSETVLAIVDVPGKMEGTVRVRWVYGGSETLNEQTFPLREEFDSYRLRLTPPDGGHRVGEYQFEVYVNEDRVETEKFTVKAQ